MSRDRIKKLLGMTTANGCTEAEALSAAAKAAKLMAELGLRPGDVEMDQDEVRSRRAGQTIRSRLWAAIGICTNTSPMLVQSPGNKANRLVYVGRDPWPEVATYLYQVTDRALNRELALFRATPWYKKRRTLRAKRQATADFTLAMVNRLMQKLLALFDATMSDMALEEARSERDARFPNGQAITHRVVSGRYHEAYERGAKAAASVQLNHGVDGTASAAPLQIGSAV